VVGPDGALYGSTADGGPHGGGILFKLVLERAPVVSIAQSNAFVIVSWPSLSTGFVLQQNTNLNTTNWTTPSESITDDGTIKFINVSWTPGNRFYRLLKP
jgi:uncharacterized repeat protein (TIGR03803 family)